MNDQPMVNADQAHDLGDWLAALGMECCEHDAEAGRSCDVLRGLCSARLRAGRRARQSQAAQQRKARQR